LSVLEEPEPDTLEIPRDLHDAMVAHCVREAPLECCGILGGVSPRVTSFHPLRNDAASETRYNADPNDLITAYISLRERGAEILAIYHSHPRWEAVPSRTDLQENHYGPVPRIIVSLLGETPVVRVWRLDWVLEVVVEVLVVGATPVVRVWHRDPDSYQELPWRIVEPATSGPGAGGCKHPDGGIDYKPWRSSQLR